MQNSQPKQVKSFRLSEDVVEKLNAIQELHKYRQYQQGLRNNFSVANVLELLINKEYEKVNEDTPE